MNKLSYIFQYIMYYIINQSNGSVNKSRLSVQNKPLKRRVQLHGEKNQYIFEGASLRVWDFRATSSLHIFSGI